MRIFYTHIRIFAHMRKYGRLVKTAQHSKAIKLFLIT